MQEGKISNIGMLSRGTCKKKDDETLELWRMSKGLLWSPIAKESGQIAHIVKRRGFDGSPTEVDEFSFAGFERFIHLVSSTLWKIYVKT